MLLELKWLISSPLPSPTELSIPLYHAPTAQLNLPFPSIMPSDSSFRSCTYLTPAAFPGLMAGTGSQLALGSDNVSYEAWLADELRPLHKGQEEEVFLFLVLSAPQIHRACIMCIF